MLYHLAQLNLARLKAPKGDPLTEEFFTAIPAINTLAEAQPGFVWRLKDEEGTSATAVETPFEDDMIIINMSVWENLESLRQFVYHTAHSYFVRRGKQWFERMERPHMVLWWVPQGHEPSPNEAAAKLEELQANGPTPAAFDWSKMFDASGQPL